jgi:hypothetical protein
MKKFLICVSIFAILSIWLVHPAFADTWGEGGDGWRSFISFEAWWDFIHNLWLP